MRYIEYDYLGREYSSPEANREALVGSAAAILLILGGLNFLPVIPVLLAVGGIILAREIGLEVKQIWTRWKGRREKKAAGGGHH